jgi:hypothetical protein
VITKTANTNSTSSERVITIFYDTKPPDKSITTHKIRIVIHIKKIPFAVFIPTKRIPLQA